MSTDQVFGGRFHFLAIKLSVLQREDEAILLRHRPTQNRSVSVELSLGRDQSMKSRADSDQGTGIPDGKWTLIALSISSASWFHSASK